MRPFIKGILVTATLALAAAVVIPNYVKARVSRSTNHCTDHNLPALAEAKTRWMKDNTARDGVPQLQDLLPYLKDGRWPECPAGGHYIIGNQGAPPTCSTAEHGAGTSASPR